jgi:hypothetical protein
LIRGSDQAKYGLLIRGFVSQYLLGNDQYPKTITRATDVLSNHKIDQRYYDTQKKNRKRLRDEQPRSEANSNPTSFAQREPQQELTCYCCGKKGNISPECDKRNAIPREQWHVNRAKQNLQEGNSTDDAHEVEADLSEDDESVQTVQFTSGQNCRSGTTQAPTRSGTPARSRTPTTTRNSHSIVRWSGFQFHERDCNVQEGEHLFTHLQDVILLDTGSTVNATFMNSDLVTNIRTTTTPISMTTNTGTKKLKLKATVPGFGSTWFDPNQIANIYGFSNLVDKYRITYDSDQEDAFLVHSEYGITKFERTNDGLYAYKPTEAYKTKLAEMKAAK